MSAPGFGRPIWLVQLSLLEAPAVVRLRRLRADRCLPGEIGARPSGRVPFLSCPKTFFILIGERLSRGKVLHYTKGQLLSLSRLPLVRLAPFGWGPPRGREQTAIGCFAYLFYYGRLGDIRVRPSSLSGRFTRESRIVPFDRDVNARDLLGIVMDFMADV
ncbi:hypothetical protein TIFTF001_049355 [Ficus carica]|uniref:Uncharacterized protein n=1 Tax=Ficus carica TaxID=3494 RepID=A0AA87Z7C5_FICCA|nr:hypothetical protein TIFTF001_049355 [Ficus carica]